MSAVAYVPVYKVAFAYQVKQGRSWTPLEHMLLWRIAERASTTNSLVAEAGMPQRLVVEALINLMESGWAQVESTGGELMFDASDLGRRLLKAKTLPPDTRMRRRGMTLLMDRLSNEFIVPEDVTVVHVDRIPLDARIIEPRAFKLTVEPRSCLERLNVRADEVFEQWVDYRVTSGRFHIQVAVSGGEVTGLPTYASAELRAAIVEEIGDDPAAAGPAPADGPIAVPGHQFGSATIDADDFIIGGDEHRDLVHTMLERAKTSFVLHSCFITENGVRALLPHVIAAAERGVRVDLLWGLRRDGLDQKGRQNLLRALAAVEDVPKTLRPKIILSGEETGSHAKLLLADSGPGGRYEAVVGSCNWLSSLYSKVEISVRLRDPWIVAEVAALAASLRMPPSGRWSHDVHRLVAIRNACNAAPRAAGPVMARLVVDGEHLIALREARDRATGRIVAGCDLLGRAAEISVFTPVRGAAATTSTTLLYAVATEGMAEQEQAAVAALDAAGIQLLRHPELHGKFMAWDDADLLVTSFNWLATKADPWKPKGAEIGVHTRCPGLAQTVLERILAKLKDTPTA